MVFPLMKHLTFNNRSVPLWFLLFAKVYMQLIPLSVLYVPFSIRYHFAKPLPGKSVCILTLFYTSASIYFRKNRIIIIDTGTRAARICATCIGTGYIRIADITTACLRTSTADIATACLRTGTACERTACATIHFRHFAKLTIHIDLR